MKGGVEARRVAARCWYFAGGDIPPNQAVGTFWCWFHGDQIDIVISANASV